MNKITLAKIIATGVLGFALGGSGVAYGQYSISGATSGDGNIVVGDGSLGALGPGAPFLSAGGGDFVTLNIGSVATSGGITIEFITSNDTLVNNGSVSVTPSGGFLGGSAVVFSSIGDLENLNFGSIDFGDPSADLTGATLINNGMIVGGSATAQSTSLLGGTLTGAIGGSAVLMIAANDIVNGTVKNSGLMLGAGITVSSGSDETSNLVGALGGSGLLAVALDNVTGLNISNSGIIAGGAANTLGGDGNLSLSFGGAGILVFAGNDINNTSFSNSGSVIGGASTAAAGPDGEAIVLGGMGASFISLDSINNFNFVNTGAISGGSASASAGELALAIGGAGVLIDASSVNEVSIFNSGNITGGSASVNAEGLPIAFGGDGVLVSSLNLGPINGLLQDLFSIDLNLFPDSASISNVDFVNTGTITGGSLQGGINILPIGSTGVSFFALSLSDTSSNAGISNVRVRNYGTISGGNGGVAGSGGDGVAFTALNLSNLDSLLSLDFSLASFDSNVPLTNIKLDNYGTITGGNGGAGEFGGDAVSFIGGTTSSSNLVVNNHGTITGGNGGAGGNAGAGIFAFASGLEINNYGVISAGNGVSNTTQAGFPAAAILIEGNNNTINLLGHSSVNGTIQGVNGTNNVLNLAFTGLSPQAIANLKAQLTAQGWPGTGGFTGTFTVRGVTYYIDPLTIGFNVSSYQLQGLTPNQTSVGTNLDSLAYNPAAGSSLANLLNAIDASGAVPAALEALSPQRYQIYGDIATAQANFTTLSIDERLNNLRDGSESVDTTGIGGSSDVTTTAGYDKDGKTVVVPDQKSLEKRWGFFAEGNGDFATVNSHGGDLTGSSFTSAGMLLGVDAKVCDHLVAGLLFDYGYTTASLDSFGSSANVETYSGGIYSGYHNGGWYANGVATYGSNNYDSTRDIIFPGFNNVALASTNGSQEDVDIDGGYDIHINDKLTVGPLAGLQYVHLDVDGFNENGAGAADLAVGSQSVDSLRSRFGFHADYRTQISKEVTFSTEVRAAWQHEFLDNSHLIDGAFIGSGLSPFGVATTDPQRDAALLGIGVNFTVRDRMTVFFDYDVQAGQESYLEQSVKGGFKLSF